MVHSLQREMDTDIIVMNAASQVGPGAMREQTSKRLPTVYIGNAFFLLIPTLIFLTEVIHAHIFFVKSQTLQKHMHVMY